MENNFRMGEKVYYFLDEETPCNTGTIIFVNNHYVKIAPDIPRYSFYSTAVVRLEHVFRDREECWRSYDRFMEENKKKIKERITSDKGLISYMYGLLRLGTATYSELKAIEEIMEDVFGEILYGNQY